MTDQAAGVSVVKAVTVQAPIQRAFAVFTDGFDGWWPRSHHIGEAEMAEAVMEPREGGRWYEKGVDGSECDWGYVIAWDPPSRVVLAWQLDAEFGYDRELVTEVEVRFTAQGPERTHVELEHRNLERYGAAMDKVRDSIGSEGGWQGLLELFAQAAAA
jgi:uncharacterized protein YndB with AHSA1/START domain